MYTIIMYTIRFPGEMSWGSFVTDYAGYSA